MTTSDKGPTRWTVACLVCTVFGNAALGQEKDFNAYPEHVAAYLKRLYDESGRILALRDDYPGGFDLISLGTDGQEGGEGDIDVGGFPGVQELAFL